MKFATKYSPPVSPAVSFSDPSMADRSQQQDCDINRIMERYRETGVLVDPLHPATAKPMFGDFTDLPDYQACLDAVIAADEAFGALPSSVRTRFENNPQKLIDFLNDESNFDEAVKLGLCNPRPVSETKPAEPAE